MGSILNYGHASVETADGSLTALSDRYKDHYHSLDGAVSQARELYLRASGAAEHPAPRVLELGFGLGVNFFVTLDNVCQRDAFLEYLALEREPADPEVLAAALNRFSGPVLDRLLAIWGSSLEIRGDCFRLRVLITDALNWQPLQNWASSVYYDPFNPKTNSDAWRPEIISRFYQATAPGGVLVTYSVASAVRKALARAGYKVSKIGARGKKRHWTRAVKPGSGDATA